MTLATSTALLWPTTTKNRPHRPKKYKNSQQVVIRQMSWFDEYIENIYVLKYFIGIFFENGSQKCILKWSYCPEMLAPFLNWFWSPPHFLYIIIWTNRYRVRDRPITWKTGYIFLYLLEMIRRSFIGNEAINVIIIR